MNALLAQKTPAVNGSCAVRTTEIQNQFADLIAIQIDGKTSDKLKLLDSGDLYPAAIFATIEESEKKAETDSTLISSIAGLMQYESQFILSTFKDSDAGDPNYSQTINQIESFDITGYQNIQGQKLISKGYPGILRPLNGSSVKNMESVLKEIINSNDVMAGIKNTDDMSANDDTKCNGNTAKIAENLYEIRMAATKTGSKTSDIHAESVITGETVKEKPLKEIMAENFEETQNTETKESEDIFKNKGEPGVLPLKDGKIEFYSGKKVVEVSDESSKINQSVLTQIKDKIKVMADEGTRQVVMELNPKSLGKLSIRMSIEDNKMTVEITAMDEKSGSILASSAHELISTLKDTYSEGTVHVTVTNESSYRANQENPDYSREQGGRGRNPMYRNFSGFEENNDDEEMTAEMLNLRNIILNRTV
jgi:flagellar hook-length control protein FliK